MKLAVLGATGKTGLEIVRQALAAGHQVTALARKPQALDGMGSGLTVVRGDATDEAVIAELVRGQDAVICSLGRPESGHSKEAIDDSVVVDVCFVSTQHLWKYLPSAGVKRIVLMSTHGAGSSNDGSPYSERVRDWVGKRLEDKDNMEAFILASDEPIDWTVIRNPVIYDGEKGQPFGVHEQIELDETSKITYADLAGFALSEAVDPKHVGKILTITEPLTGSAVSA
jgi:putative NADH-flavin reductase